MKRSPTPTLRRRLEVTLAGASLLAGEAFLDRLERDLADCEDFLLARLAPGAGARLERALAEPRGALERAIAGLAVAFPKYRRAHIATARRLTVRRWSRIQ